MRLLELFSGTGSVGRVFRARGWEVVSLDLDARACADITTNILDWDFKVFADDHFDCIGPRRPVRNTASPAPRRAGPVIWSLRTP